MKKSNRGKLFLVLGMVYFLFAFGLNKFDDKYEDYKLIAALVLALVSLILFAKFYLEDKKEGLPLTKYFVAFGFILFSGLYSLYMMFYT